MRFKFCGDGDCPLWALAALHALGALPAQLFRALLHHLMDEKDEDGIMEILKDTSLSSREESARAAAAVRWVVRSTWSCGCPSGQLMRDLVVLGVPRTHATALAEAADQYREAYVEGVASNGFAVNKLTGVSVSPSEGALSLALQSGAARAHMRLDSTQAKDLLRQLCIARERMDEVDRA